MTTAVRQLLDSFNALNDVEKHQAAVELLRQVEEETSGAISDQAFIEAADDLFRDLDAREATDGQSQSR